MSHPFLKRCSGGNSRASVSKVMFLSELPVGQAQKTCFLDIEKALQKSRCCLGLLAGRCSAEGIGVFAAGSSGDQLY